MRVIIAKIGNHETVSFAAKEICRLIKKMDGTVVLDVRKYASFDESLKNVIWVGLGFTDKSETDSIAISVKKGNGYISGSNERSVLIAAYRFMKGLGCAYIYPGKEGEIIPERKLSYTDLTVSVKETASYNHRGICIEGTTGYEHVHNMIDWIPKVGMNEYFFQFFTPATFFNQYYRRFGKELDDSEVDAIVEVLGEDIKKRSINYSAVGHGWTCAPFGLPASGWYKCEGEIPEKTKEILALVNGERKFIGDIPLNTNLCFSNAFVRKSIVDYTVEYCKNNINKNYIAFFLSDGENNHCECENCKEKIPSDYLVIMLNEIDARLTELGIDTRLVFPVYNDLMWAPVTQKFNNPDRFVCMFAPISRSYSVSYADVDFEKNIEIEPYVRNKNNMHYSLIKAVKMADIWRKGQNCKNNVLFDYHLMWDHHFDPGYYNVAKILQKDITALDKIGVDGMVSCQLQRVAFPNNLPMYCMAKTLWNKNETFSDIVNEYFTVAYGEYAEEAENYLKTLSELFTLEVLRGEKPVDKDAMIEKLEKAKAVVERFNDEYVEKNKETSKSFEYLFYHTEFVKLYADIYIGRFLGDEEMCKAAFDKFQKVYYNVSEATDTVLDEFLCGTVYNNLFGWRRIFLEAGSYEADSC